MENPAVTTKASLLSGLRLVGKIPTHKSPNLAYFWVTFNPPSFTLFYMDLNVCVLHVERLRDGTSQSSM